MKFLPNEWPTRFEEVGFKLSRPSTILLGISFITSSTYGKVISCVNVKLWSRLMSLGIWVVGRVMESYLSRLVSMRIY